MRIKINVFSVFLAFACLLAASCHRADSESKVDFRSQLADMDRLVLAEMAVGKVGRVADGRVRDATNLVQAAEAALDHLKLGTRIGVYSFTTYVTASVDLSQLRDEDVRVDPETRHVEVVLPPLQIDFAGRDLQMTEEHVRVTGLRSAITPGERAELKNRMSAQLREELRNDADVENRLREAARQSAVRLVEGLASQAGYTAGVHFSQ